MIIFRDGKPFNTDYQDIYASDDGAVEQARHVFLNGNQLPARFTHHRGLTVVGELGFGFGTNFLTTADSFLNLAHQNDRLFFASCELHPPEIDQLREGHRRLPLPQHLLPDLYRQWPNHSGFHLLTFAQGRINLLLMIEDARQAWSEFSGSIDAWYLDGFSPAKNPALWSADLFNLLRTCSAPTATFATYSVSGKVREAMATAGWNSERTAGFGRKKEMLRGTVPGLMPPTGSTPRQVTIVGAGLAGSSLATALTRRGVAVTLCDRQREPQGASGNPAGILMPMAAKAQDPLARLCARGFQYTVTLLHAEPAVFQPTGVRYIPPKSKPLLPANQLPFTAEIHPPDAWSDKNSLFIAQGGMVFPGRFCHWLRHQAGELLEFRELELKDWHAIEHDPDRPLILATGAEMRDWPDLGWLPLRRLYGQVSLFPATALRTRPDHILCSDAYLLPLGKEFLIGATFDEQELPYSPERITGLLTELQQAFRLEADTALAQQNHGRVAFRTVTYDRYPLVGRLPVVDKFAHLPDGLLAKQARLPDDCFIPGVRLLTGFGSRGLSLAPLAAEALAAELCGEPLPFEKSLWQRLDAARFLLRNRRRPEELRISF